MTDTTENDAISVTPTRKFTDAELTEIYCAANNIPAGKSPPITTQRIFAAMRFIANIK
jgi:hypothetical protein